MRSRLPLSMRMRKVVNYAPPSADFSPTDVGFSHVYWTGGTEFTALGLSDTDAVSSWPDEVGTADLSQATGSKQGQYLDSGINSQPSVDLDGVDDWMATADNAFSYSNPSMVLIFQQDSLTGDDNLVDGQSINARHVIRDSSGSYIAGVAAGEPAISFGTADTNPHIIWTITANGGPGQFSGTLDGVEVVGASTAVDALTAFHLGVAYDEVNYDFGGDFSFVGVYDGDPTQDPNWFNFLDWVYDTYAIDARPPSLVGWAHSYWTSGPEFEALGLADGAAVSSWPDETGTDDLAQATGTAQPSYNATGTVAAQPSVQGDGTDDVILKSLAASITQDVTVAAVANLGATQSGNFPRIVDTGNNGIYCVLQSLAWNVHLGFGTAFDTDHVIPSYAYPHLWLGYGNGASSQVELDGDNKGTGDAGTNGASLVSLGGDSGAAGSFHNGEYFFVGVFDGDVRSDPYWEQCESYLRWKYGLWDPHTMMDWDHSYLADDITTEGAVETWPDGSGSADLTQATGTNQPTRDNNGPNGNPSVTGDGSDDYIVGSPLTSWATASRVSTVLIFDFAPGNTDGQKMWDFYSTGSGQGGIQPPNAYTDMPTGRSWTGNNYTFGPHILVIENENGAVDQENLWLDGVWDADGPQTSQYFPNQVGLFNLGGLSNASDVSISFVGMIEHTNSTRITDLDGWQSFLDWAYHKYGTVGFNPVVDVGWSHAYWTEGAEFDQQGYADTNAVDTWPDEVGSDDIAQATGTNQPSYDADGGPNSTPAVAADGTDDSLGVNWSGGVKTGDLTYVVIGNFDATGAGALIGGRDSTHKQLLAMTATPDWQIYAGGTSQTAGTGDTSDHMFRAAFDGSSGAEELDVDGTNIISADGGSHTSSGFNAFNRYSNLSPSDSNIAFIGVYEGDPRTDPNWQRFLDWAREHYGLPVAIG